jgi:long-chain acyl-CoA synthetase
MHPDIVVCRHRAATMHLLRKIQWNILRRPFRQAIVDDQRTWRAFELQCVAWHIARHVERLSTRERIGIMVPTSGLFPAALMAVWSLGRTAVPLNYLLSRPDLEHVCRDAELDLCITVGRMLDFVGGLPDQVRPLQLETLSFGGLPPIRRSRPMPSDRLAMLLYTSGTSGKPKGVMLSAGNFAANIEQIIGRAQFNPRDVLLGVLPQFHSMGVTVMTLLPLALGCKVVYAARFVPKRIFELARSHRPSVIVAIPSMYGALRTVKDAHADDLRSLRFVVSGGEPLPQAVANGFHERFGKRICEGFGLTETAPVCNWCLPNEWRERSVGRALDGIQQKIVAADGSDVTASAEGEIRIKGPNVMQGYWNLAEETSAVFDSEGFFRTGDIGRIDGDGHLYITGRLKEMLIIGGENVFPREIEEVLDRHSTVKASACIGVVDSSRGEVPIAFVECKEGESFDAGALRTWCREHLPQFKVPREIRHLDPLPRNPTGKIIRRALKQMLEDSQRVQ